MGKNVFFTAVHISVHFLIANIVGGQFAGLSVLNCKRKTEKKLQSQFSFKVNYAKAKFVQLRRLAHGLRPVRQIERKKKSSLNSNIFWNISLSVV